MGAERGEAIVVGAGPNGLAAAVTLAQAGKRVRLIEAAPTIGGGCRSAPLTLPGFLHDVCAAAHPLARASRFFRTLSSQLEIDWIQPPAAVAHPLDDGTAVLSMQSLDETARRLGADERAYRNLMQPFVDGGTGLLDDLLGPLSVPRHPLAMARFGLVGLRSATGVAAAFQTAQARALFAGMAAHSMLPLDQPGSAAAGLVLAMLAHQVGWPMPKGGSQQIVDALGERLRALGGAIEVDRRVTTLDEFPRSAVQFLDLAPRDVARVAGDRLPERYRRRLKRFRQGWGSFKVDFALDGPIPWQAAECAQAGTVHLGGTLEEIATGEAATSRGEHSARPFVLLCQQSLFDPTRAPDGNHTVWAYCHVPHGSTRDMTDVIEGQIERFAPGFRRRILAKTMMGPADFERYNANYVGGGVQDLRQLFTRPTPSLRPYGTPDPRLFICSASTARHRRRRAAASTVSAVTSP